MAIVFKSNDDDDGTLFFFVSESIYITKVHARVCDARARAVNHQITHTHKQKIDPKIMKKPNFIKIVILACFYRMNSIDDLNLMIYFLVLFFPIYQSID